VVAHEVNNHLQTGILAMSLLAEKLGNLGETTLAEFGTTGRDKLMELSKFTNDLLKYSGTDDNADPERVDLQKLVEEVTEELKASGLTGNTTIEAKALPRILAVPVQIKHLINNLIRNALLHGRAGDRPLQITISATIAGDTATISIADDGRGIPEEHRAKIFEYFYRGDSLASGSGIGLAYCAQVLHRMEQRLWVEEAQPHGAVFFFTAAIAGERK